MKSLNRRHFTGLLGAATLATPLFAQKRNVLRLGLTPVFPDNVALIIDRLRDAFSAALNTEVVLEQRRTYEEVTGLLLGGLIDAAWLCGYPFLQHKNALSLLAVPIWKGRPEYQSYLIVGRNDGAGALADLEGGGHMRSLTPTQTRAIWSPHPNWPA